MRPSGQSQLRILQEFTEESDDVRACGRFFQTVVKLLKGGFQFHKGAIQLDPGGFVEQVARAFPELIKMPLDPQQLHSLENKLEDMDLGVGFAGHVPMVDRPMRQRLSRDR
jgi:hypothetical protein